MKAIIIMTINDEDNFHSQVEGTPLQFGSMLHKASAVDGFAASVLLAASAILQGQGEDKNSPICKKLFQYSESILK